MVRATYQSRLSAIILGIRPSVAHVYGSTDRPPADNLTNLGIEAWRVGLRQLHTDMCAQPSLDPTERWIHDWLTVELRREQARWHDASTLLELLAVTLGPASPDPTTGPRGRLFWDQWRRNLAYHVSRVETGATVATPDTAELLEHTAHLASEHNGPQAVLDDLATVGRLLSETFGVPASFRPMASAVERLQLSAIMASSYDDQPVCSAAMAKLLEQRSPSIACRADARRHRRARGIRPGSTFSKP